MAIDPLRQAKSELSAASRSIEDMASATSFEEFEAGWRAFLTCLEKAWTKTERICEPHRAQFQPWQGRFQALRKKDMLLRYLKHARDADNHTIQDLAELQPGYTSIDFVGGGGGYIEYMELDAQKGLVEYRGTPVQQTVVPPQPIAVPVQTCGHWYNPPTSHMGNVVHDLNPLNLAQLGLTFYADFVDQVERKFFPR